LSNDEDDNEIAADYLRKLALAGGEFSINIEYTLANVNYVTLVEVETKYDIGKRMVAEGYVRVDRSRRERRFQKLMTEYFKVLQLAKQSHKNIWKYGDNEDDEANEFGAPKPVVKK
jgi:endonuclease YncB( thermonuclease family)